ncbi:LacI family transcriptional regulator [Catellatospora sp. IY07-71]|uniref:LacI family DNA-binding transcriptional regulator n=1 Tax=Catellatospora sp. IY07-71 TaxID=2728827 RepID=UPI001BB3D21C|nr:LacI family DNA-binding transcriptional regulator [Catellatospora sp. IY07-71]BCJ74301.1 LacI family transcriptional regulator [Catellatospora sp. IY07-71]
MTSDQTPAQRLPTLEDVAQVAGVSRATVSRVINNIRNVDPQLHKIVWDAVSTTGYVPNRAARSLVTGRTGSIALVVSEAENRAADDPFLGRFFSDPFFGRVVGGVLSVLRPSGVHLALTLAGDEDACAKVVADVRQGQVDGVVVLSLHPHDPLPRLLADAAVPAVLYGRPAAPMPISYVDVATYTGAKLAADHLAARGCQHVATISGSVDMPAGADRLHGFREAMAKQGVAYVPSYDGGFTHEGGERAMERLLAEHPETDGVFVASDVMAQGALAVLRDHGKSVPDDVAVVGFDDSSAALASRPQLTTVRQPVEDMAAEMARLLLARIDQRANRTTSVIFDPELILRASA